MIKYVIKKNNLDAVFIFHALPDERQEISKFQWYITEDKNLQGKPIQNQEFESYSFTTSQIKINGYSGKYLYCEYSVINEILAQEFCKRNKYLGSKITTEPVKTEYIKLYPNVNEMVNDGVIFDDIAEFDEHGDIISDKKDKL